MKSHKTLNMTYKKFLAWFIIDYFTHNIDLIAQKEKVLDLKVPITILSLQNNQIMFGNLNGLIHYF